MRRLLVLLLIFSMLFTTVAVSGCTTSTITSPEQAAGAITNISEDVQDVASTLEDIDSVLG